jgi:hypothetical protein
VALSIALFPCFHDTCALKPNAKIIIEAIGEIEREIRYDGK